VDLGLRVVVNQGARVVVVVLDLRLLVDLENRPRLQNPVGKLQNPVVRVQTVIHIIRPIALVLGQNLVVQAHQAALEADQVQSLVVPALEVVPDQSLVVQAH